MVLFDEAEYVQNVDELALLNISKPDLIKGKEI